MGDIKATRELSHFYADSDALSFTLSPAVSFLQIKSNLMCLHKKTKVDFSFNVRMASGTFHSFCTAFSIAPQCTAALAGSIQ